MYVNHMVDRGGGGRECWLQNFCKLKKNINWKNSRKTNAETMQFGE